MEVKYLCANYSHPDIAAGWSDAIHKLCSGEHPHAAGMMTFLLQERLAPRRDLPHKKTTTVSQCDDDLPEWIMCSYGGWAAALKG